MTRLLGATRCEGLEAALNPPLYGVRCARPGGYITVRWDGGGRGEVRLADGSVAATAEARYILLNDEQLERFKAELGFWQVIPDDAPAK